MGKPRGELSHKALVETFIGTDIEVRYYTNSWVKIS
jgi:hypothetical protein